MSSVISWDLSVSLQVEDNYDLFFPIDQKEIIQIKELDRQIW